MVLWFCANVLFLFSYVQMRLNLYKIFDFDVYTSQCVPRTLFNGCITIFGEWTMNTWIEIVLHFNFLFHEKFNASLRERIFLHWLSEMFFLSTFIFCSDLKSFLVFFPISVCYKNAGIPNAIRYLPTHLFDHLLAHSLARSFIYLFLSFNFLSIWIC